MRHPLVLLLLATSLSLAGEPDRPTAWAVPLKVPGVPNLHRVNDDLYRSAQPTAEGMKNVQALGIRTVIDLRAGDEDADRIRGTTLESADFSLRAWRINQDELVRVLRRLGKKEDGPFLVHCAHGADRTGVVCALYRIVYQGWSRERAIEEMTQGGYGFHKVWKNLVRYVREVDVDQLRAAVLETPSAQTGGRTPP
jgi:protein tyrosine/serine phosphatase